MQVIIRWFGLLLAAACLAAPRTAEACAACFGRTDSPMAQGMNMGILTLLIVITSVLVAIALFFGYILRRAARLARQQHAAGAVAEFSDVLPKSDSGPNS